VANFCWTWFPATFLAVLLPHLLGRSVFGTPVHCEIVIGERGATERAVGGLGLRRSLVVYTSAEFVTLMRKVSDSPQSNPRGGSLTRITGRR